MTVVSTSQIFFLWNLWECVGRTGPNRLRTEITSSLPASPPPPLCCHITGVTLRRDVLVAVHPFITHTLPRGALAWETFWESYSAPPWEASEERGK